MPELPDITVYIEALESRLVGQALDSAILENPFLLRSVQPTLADCEGRRVIKLKRLGKRIAIGFDGELWLVLHLMIAGRLHWYEKGYKGKVRQALLKLQFSNGLLTLTEAGKKRRASLHVIESGALYEHDRGGLEVLEESLENFSQRLTERNHTLKRTLTDPTIFSGIGNAYSDEILHSAGLSPMLQTRHLNDEQIEKLFTACCEVLHNWTMYLRTENGDSFPEKVTAFREGMAVHGRYGKPCPVCNTAVQRIRYAEHETNYCPRCQTGDKLLADRALSRLLKQDWPKTIEALENAGKS